MPEACSSEERTAEAGSRDLVFCEDLEQNA